MKTDIKFTDEFKSKIPHFRVLQVEAEIDNGETDDLLWEALCRFMEAFRATHEMPDINKRPEIAATRQAYKTLGKEPNRYRPSAEALCRRAVKGLDLYRTLKAIDVVNLISMQTGHSIGGFDADKIQGDTITLGVGAHEEPFAAIGRGELNIEFLPIYRDDVGGIGTPTSDNERTKLTPATKNLLLTINVYDSETDIEALIPMVKEALEIYLDARNICFAKHSVSD